MRQGESPRLRPYGARSMHSMRVIGLVNTVHLARGSPGQGGVVAGTSQILSVVNNDFFFHILSQAR